MRKRHRNVWMSVLSVVCVWQGLVALCQASTVAMPHVCFHGGCSLLLDPSHGLTTTAPNLVTGWADSTDTHGTLAVSGTPQAVSGWWGAPDSVRVHVDGAGGVFAAPVHVRLVAPNMEDVGRTSDIDLPGFGVVMVVQPAQTAAVQVLAAGSGFEWAVDALGMLTVDGAVVPDCHGLYTGLPHIVGFTFDAVSNTTDVWVDGIRCAQLVTPTTYTATMDNTWVPGAALDVGLTSRSGALPFQGYLGAMVVFARRPCAADMRTTADVFSETTRVAGLSRRFPAPDCVAIMEAGQNVSAGSARYWIDMDGCGPFESTPMLCDMDSSRDGGGWLTLSEYYPGGPAFLENWFENGLFIDSVSANHGALARGWVWRASVHTASHHFRQFLMPTHTDSDGVFPPNGTASALASGAPVGGWRGQGLCKQRWTDAFPDPSDAGALDWVVSVSHATPDGVSPRCVGASCVFSLDWSNDVVSEVANTWSTCHRTLTADDGTAYAAPVNVSESPGTAHCGGATYDATGVLFFACRDPGAWLTTLGPATADVVATAVRAGGPETFARIPNAVRTGWQVRPLGATSAVPTGARASNAGTSRETPARSCIDVHWSRPDAPTGAYWVDFDGPCGAQHAATRVWCTMEEEERAYDGGGWMTMLDAHHEAASIDVARDYRPALASAWTAKTPTVTNNLFGDVVLRSSTHVSSGRIYRAYQRWVGWDAHTPHEQHAQSEADAEQGYTTCKLQWDDPWTHHDSWGATNTGLPVPCMEPSCRNTPLTLGAYLVHTHAPCHWGGLAVDADGSETHVVWTRPVVNATDAGSFCGAPLTWTEFGSAVTTCWEPDLPQPMPPPEGVSPGHTAWHPWRADSTVPPVPASAIRRINGTTRVNLGVRAVTEEVVNGGFERPRMLAHELGWSHEHLVPGWRPRGANVALAASWHTGASDAAKVLLSSSQFMSLQGACDVASTVHLRPGLRYELSLRVRAGVAGSALSDEGRLVPRVEVRTDEGVVAWWSPDAPLAAPRLAPGDAQFVSTAGAEWHMHVVPVETTRAAAEIVISKGEGCTLGSLDSALALHVDDVRLGPFLVARWFPRDGLRPSRHAYELWGTLGGYTRAEAAAFAATRRRKGERGYLAAIETSAQLEDLGVLLSGRPLWLLDFGATCVPPGCDRVAGVGRGAVEARLIGNATISGGALRGGPTQDHRLNIEPGAAWASHRMTVSARIRWPSGYSGYVRVFDFGSTGFPGSDNILLGITHTPPSSAMFAWSLYHRGHSSTGFATASLEPERWHTVTIAYEARGLTCYVNGRVLASSDYAGDSAVGLGDPYNGVREYRVGASHWPTETLGRSGEFAWLAAWETALTADQIRHHFLSPDHLWRASDGFAANEGIAPKGARAELGAGVARAHVSSDPVLVLSRDTPASHVVLHPPPFLLFGWAVDAGRTTPDTLSVLLEGIRFAELSGQTGATLVDFGVPGGPNVWRLSLSGALEGGRAGLVFEAANGTASVRCSSLTDAPGHRLRRNGTGAAGSGHVVRAGVWHDIAIIWSPLGLQDEDALSLGAVSIVVDGARVATCAAAEGVPGTPLMAQNASAAGRLFTVGASNARTAASQISAELRGVAVWTGLPLGFGDRLVEWSALDRMLGRAWVGLARNDAGTVRTSVDEIEWVYTEGAPAEGLIAWGPALDNSATLGDDPWSAPRPTDATFAVAHANGLQAVAGDAPGVYSFLIEYGPDNSFGHGMTMAQCEQGNGTQAPPCCDSAGCDGGVCVVNTCARCFDPTQHVGSTCAACPGTCAHGCDGGVNGTAACLADPDPPNPSPSPSTVNNDLFGDSAAAKPFAIAGYLVCAVVLVSLLVSSWVRRRWRQRYRAEPEHWLGMDVDQYVAHHHTVVGIVVSARTPNDPFTMFPRAMYLCVSLLVEVLVVVVLMWLSPSTFDNNGNRWSLTLEQALQSLLVTVVASLAFAFSGGPLIRRALHSLDPATRRAGVVLAGVVAGVLALLVTALMVVPMFVDGFVVALGPVIYVVALSWVLSACITQVAVLVFQYYVFGRKALHVLKGGNGGAVGNAVAPKAGSPACSDASSSASGKGDSAGAASEEEALSMSLEDGETPEARTRARAVGAAGTVGGAQLLHDDYDYSDQ